MLQSNFSQRCGAQGAGQEGERDLDAEIAAVLQDLQDHPVRPARPHVCLSEQPGEVEALQKQDIGLWDLLDWAVNGQCALDYFLGLPDGPMVPTRSCDIPEYGDIGVRVDVSAKGDMAVHQDAVASAMAVSDVLGQAAADFWPYVRSGVLPRFVSDMPARRVVPLLRGTGYGVSVRDLLDMSGSDYWDYLLEAVPDLDFSALCNSQVCVRYSKSRKVCAWDVRFVGFSDDVILADSLALCRQYERFICQLDDIFERLSTAGLRCYRLQGLGVAREPWLDF